MVKFEKISTPSFSSQLENKVLYSQHDQDISISYQSTYTLKYVLEGSKNYTFGNRKIEVSKYQYLFLNEGMNIHTEASKGTVGLSFFLSPKLIFDIYSNHYNHSAPKELFELSQSNPNSGISLLLQNTFHQFEVAPSVSEPQIEEVFIKIAELIIQEQATINERFKKLDILKYNTQRELYKFVSLSKEFINDNFHSGLTLDSLSKNVGVSKYYLHRLFTELTGTTPLQYLTKVRLEKAKHQLQNGKNSILEVALDCGFESSAYFSRVFKKHIGLSPSHFRQLSE